MSDLVITTARDIMSSHFIEVDGLMTVDAVIHRMKAENISVVLIKKRNAHDAHGIVLLADIAKKVLAKDRAPERVNVYEIMSKPVVTVEPELDVRYCARLFDRFGLSVAPVVENDQIIGVVSYGDLVLRGLFARIS
jgi:CBS domain-containing protein